MANRFKSLGFRIPVALLFFAGLANLPVRADDQGKTVTIELKSATQIPGTTLKPGTYVFRLSGRDAGWNIIQVYNADQTSLITTVLAYPNPKLQRTGDQVLMYSHGVKNGPHVMKGWFFDGDNEAQQWAYPNAVAQKIGQANHDRIPTTGTDDIYPSSLPKAAESWTPPVTTASNESPQDENSATSGQPSAATAHARKLPRTASPMPLVGLIGVLAALGIVVLRKTVSATA